MTRLLSVTEVRDLWPDPKPTAKAIKRLAREHNCCRKIGRAVGFTESDVQQLLAACSSSTAIKSHRTGMYAAPSPDGGYAKVRKRLIEDGRKRTVAREMANFLTHSDFGSNRPLRGVKR
jgi:hypothetical protein